jgi:predicted thioesterase
MTKVLEVGLVGETSILVNDKETAMSYGSGLVAVFSTPAMIALMEGAAVACTADCFDTDTSTVGIAIDIKHMAATPVGMWVKARAELLEIDGKRLRFKIQAIDEKEVIGEGFHERYIIKIDRFYAKAKAKL